MSLQSIFLCVALILASPSVKARPVGGDLKLSHVACPTPPRPYRVDSLKALNGPKRAPIILDAWDYVEITLPAADFPQARTSYLPYPDLDAVIEPFAVDDIFYVWAEDLVFDRWGAPNTELASWNGYQFEQSDFGFIGGRNPSFAGIQTLEKNPNIKVNYDPNVDPATLDLPDGEPLDTYFYAARKSQCYEDGGGSPLCPPYRISELSYFSFLLDGFGDFSIEPQIKVLRYSQDPEKGNPPPDEILEADEIYFVKLKSEVLKIKIKLN